ncbi:MAG: response regulator [Sulfurovum sp.]|nr:response regulator [Sulfurovum sp.]
MLEDELITQRTLQTICSDLGVEVSGCFDNALDTIVALKSIECDMLLLDIDIKGSMDGIQLARHILKERSIPIVFITSHNDDETVEELLELAPYGFVSKPFSPRAINVTMKIAYKRYLTHSSIFYTEEDKKERDIILDESLYLFDRTL